ncbi:hypothetical protein CN555_14065 [Bacillus wiedmannii]|nr:hypothetical protein CN555_14065 [Bacillus wiedmannii]PGA99556.1 hypothetical protein COL92_07165 [Bacillus wiedmannii]
MIECFLLNIEFIQTMLNFQKVVERTAGYDINQQTLVEENVLILNNILFWSTLFLMYISQQQRQNILYYCKQSLCICEVIGKAGPS